MLAVTGATWGRHQSLVGFCRAPFSAQFTNNLDTGFKGIISLLRTINGEELLVLMRAEKP